MRQHGHRAWVGSVLLAFAAVVLVLPVGLVWAHAELVSSDPADGAVLAAAPAAVSFTFGEQLLSQGNAVTVQEQGTGAQAAVAEPVVSGDTISVAWPEGAGAGQYRIAYRVVSADGHPITGSISVTIGGSSGTPSPSPATIVESTAPPVAVAATPAPADEEESGGAGVLAWVLILGVALLVGAAAGTWFTRRSRGR